MAKKTPKNESLPADEKLQPPLRAGVKLLRTFTGHTDVIRSVAFDPQGRILASGGDDTTVKLWDVESGELLKTLDGHQDFVTSVAFDPQGNTLASGSDDCEIKLWDVQTGQLIHTLTGHNSWVLSVAFDPCEGTLASASVDCAVKLWNTATGKLTKTLHGHYDWVRSVAFSPNGRVLASGSSDDTVKLWDTQEGICRHSLAGHERNVRGVAFHPDGKLLASGSRDKTVKVWKASSGKLLRTLEGHTAQVDAVAFSGDGQLLASKSADGTIQIWSCHTWEMVAVIPVQASEDNWIPALAFHPTRPLLATAGSAQEATEHEHSRLIHLWELDCDVLFGQLAKVTAMTHHTTSKIVIVGDHSVGKSALAYRLIHGEFKEQAATHGQQFWVFPELSKQRADGTECEAILWDFAGQPDYRLVHALFVDNADMALVLFDTANLRDPLHGVEFWLKQLKIRPVPSLPAAQQDGRAGTCLTILVAAQTDRGTCSLTPAELRAFCERHGIAGPIATSAYTGQGMAELVEQMKSLIPWDDKPATVTTATFKRIKDYVLGLKEAGTSGQCIVTPEELRVQLEATDAAWKFTDAEMMTAVGHLENYGYVKRLRTSKGQQRVMLQPERLNNLASSFVLEARRNEKGLGALEERRLLAGDYPFQELAELHDGERDVLLDAAALLFLEHNVCFRETDPLRMEPYLVFPELINLKKSPENEMAMDDGVSYTVYGPTENVFASLVVLLGYTHTFTRTNQWNNNARYEFGGGLLCGFREEAERDGELDFVLCFSPAAGEPVRTLFQGLFESFLARRNLTVRRLAPVRCSNAACRHWLDRSVARQRMKEGKTFAFCNECGERLALPKMAEPIQLSQQMQAEVESQRRVAEQRTRFEQAVYRVRAYIADQQIMPPECFISYAWGVTEHERWVEKRLVDDLQKAGLRIVFDRKDSQYGDSLTRFVSRIPYCASVVVIGTPLYFQKFENRLVSTGSVVAAEVDLISQRLIGTQEEKRTVKTLLLAGEKKTSLPPLMWDGIYADFRDDLAYFTTAFDLILSLYQLPPTDQAVADLRESLRGLEVR